MKIKNIINTRQLSAELGWEHILKYEMILGWKSKKTLIRDLKRNNAVREFFDRESATYYFSDTALKDILNQYYKDIEPEIYKKIRSMLFPS